MASVSTHACWRSAEMKPFQTPAEINARPICGAAIVTIRVVWTCLYHLVVEDQNSVHVFFELLDTVSDFVMRALVTVGSDLDTVFVFSATELYTQTLANIYFFASSKVSSTITSEESRTTHFAPRH